MHRRTFFKLNAAGALGELLRPLAGLKHMPVEFDDRGLAIIGNNVKAISFYDDARTLRAQIFLDGNNALNVSTTVISGSTSSSGAPAGIESAAFLVLASDTTLLGERVLALGSGLVGADGGPGGGYSLDVSTTVVRTTRQVVSGAGLTGGGDLSADRTLAVGAGTGISVAADTVGIDLTASLTWTGAHVFQNTLTTRTILPEATDTYNLGSSTKLWNEAYISQINAVVFAEQTLQLLGGWFVVPKDAGALGADVSSGATTVNFGKAMTVGDFVLIRAHDTGGVIKAEYMTVGTLVSGTTYNVTRDLAGAHGTDPAWSSGTPFMVLGQNGNGRIELNAYDTPRIQIIKQGAAYNAQTETVRIGDLNGSFGIATELYGVGIGDYSGGNYFRYDTTNGLVVKGGGGNVQIDNNGLTLSGGQSNPNMVTWSTAGNAVFQVYGANLGLPFYSSVAWLSATGYGSNPGGIINLLANNSSDSSKNAAIKIDASAGAGPLITFTGKLNDLNLGTATGAGNGSIKMSGSVQQSTALWARAYNSVALTVTTATWTLVTLDSERNDTDTLHSTASNTGRLTAARDGLYLVVFNGNFASNSTGFRGVQVRLNAAGNAASGTAIAVKSVAAVNGDRTGLNLVTLYQLSAGDYVESFVYQNSGGNLNLDAVANYSPEFEMTRIA